MGVQMAETTIIEYRCPSCRAVAGRITYEENGNRHTIKVYGIEETPQISMDAVESERFQSLIKKDPLWFINNVSVDMRLMTLRNTLANKLGYCAECRKFYCAKHLTDRKMAGDATFFSCPHGHQVTIYD